MKRHTKNYLDAFYENWGPDDFFICEICLIKYRTENRGVDVHHIEARGMGSSTKKDDPVNLMCLCRLHHNQCENQKFSKNEQKHLHRQFIKWQLSND